MCDTQPKKMSILNILKILREHSDADHTLSLEDIKEKLRTEYQMDVERKAIKRNLMNLAESDDYDIKYTETKRLTKNRSTGELEERVVLTDYYLVREFTDSELRLLIDSLLFSKHIPYSQCMELIEKLEGLSNKYFSANVKHIKTMPDNTTPNQELFLTIEVLEEAISKGKQVSLVYNRYGTDKKLHPTLGENGKPKVQLINPYQMAAANGRYYLICNNDNHDNLANYRLDRITKITLLDTPRKPMTKVKGLEHGLDLPKHMAEHIYMFSGESAAVKMRVKKIIIDDVIDWFGKDVKFYDETEDEVSVRVTVNLNAMRRWALQYSLYAQVIMPTELRDLIAKDIKQAAENYGL